MSDIKPVEEISLFYRHRSSERSFSVNWLHPGI